jgi:DNA-directed RNA polymerase subunit RPC12/RpoP
MVAKPAPPASREVLCHHCNRPIEVAIGAMTVNCRHCNRRVVLEDVKIKAYHAVLRLETAGKLEIQRKGNVVADVRVNELVIDGKVKGNITCIGPVKIGKKAEVLGNVSCRSLDIGLGAVIEGHVHIDPNYAPSAPVAEEEEEDDGLLRR